MTGLLRVGLTDHVTGHSQRKMPKKMAPEMMRRLLGGKWPNDGFSWDMVYEFRLEADGIWEPYNGLGEILPAPGFRAEAVVQSMNLFGGCDDSEMCEIGRMR